MDDIVENMGSFMFIFVTIFIVIVFFVIFAFISVPQNPYCARTPYPVNSSAIPQPMTLSGQPVPGAFSPPLYQNQNQLPYPTTNMGMPLPMPSSSPYPGPPYLNAASVPLVPPNAGEVTEVNPPSYGEATGKYERQAAYNPNFK